MPLNKSLVALAAMNTLALLGCQGTMPREQAADTGAALFVSQNLVGEKCAVKAEVVAEVAEFVTEGYQIYCGDWEHVTARIYRVDQSSGDLHAWVSPQASGNWWRQFVDQRASCDPPREATLLEDKAALLMDCRLRNGGWPFSAVVVSVGESVYLSDGIPAALSVVEETIGVVSGTATAPDDDAIRRRGFRINQWRQRISQEVYGASDLDEYYRLMMVGQYYDSVHQFAEAERRFRKALLLQERLLGVENPEILDPMMHLALQLSNQERFDEADVLFDRVEKGLAQRPDAADKTRYLSYRAIHAANQHRYGDGIAYARQATAERLNALSAAAGGGAATTALAGVAGGRVSMAELAQGYYLEAAMLQRVGESSEASDLLKSAEGIVAAEPRVPPTWKPRMLQLDAELASRAGDGRAPITKLEGARDLLVKQLPDERPTALANLELGRRQVDARQFDQALNTFRAGLKLLRQQKGHLRYHQIKPFLDLVIALGKADPESEQALFKEAFDAAQLIKTKRAVEGIARVAARLAEGDTKVSEAIRQLQDAEDRRSLLFQEYDAELGRVYAEQDKARLAELREQIELIEQEVLVLGEAAQAANPRYYQLVGSPASLDAVLSTLRPSEALVQLLFDPQVRDGYLLLVDRGRVKIQPLGLTFAQASRYVDRLRDGLTIKTSESGGQYVPDFDLATAHTLYQQLFGPIQAELQDVEHLIAVPSEPLLSLPLNLLLTEEAPSDRAYPQAAWLINKFALSVVPSARSLVDLRATARPSNATKDFIAFADFVPVSDQEAQRIRPNLTAECRAVPEHVDEFRRQLTSFSPLHGTRKEVTAIAADYPQDRVKLILGERFNDVSLNTGSVSKQLQEFRIVHFATHGLLPAEISCQSDPALATSYSDKAGTESDGLLDAQEINTLNLDAELVVLSACNTAGSGGEALSGLAKSFFYAGARSLIVSHWSMLEKPTTSLMIDTFNRRRLHGGGGIGWSEALRQAQLKAIEAAGRSGQPQFAHPFFWGAFAVVGDGARSTSPGIVAQRY